MVWLVVAWPVSTSQGGEEEVSEVVSGKRSSQPVVTGPRPSLSILRKLSLRRGIVIN